MTWMNKIEAELLILVTLTHSSFNDNVLHEFLKGVGRQKAVHKSKFWTAFCHLLLFDFNRKIRCFLLFVYLFL